MNKKTFKFEILNMISFIQFTTSPLHYLQPISSKMTSKRARQTHDLTMKDRKTKWNVQPLLGQMLTAVKEVRVENKTTTIVSERYGIPIRTLRRYIRRSKYPSNGIFYIKVEEKDVEEKDVEEEYPVSWKPQSAVPMFAQHQVKRAKVTPTIPYPTFAVFPEHMVAEAFTELFAKFPITFSNNEFLNPPMLPPKKKVSRWPTHFSDSDSDSDY